MSLHRVRRLLGVGSAVAKSETIVYISGEVHIHTRAARPDALLSRATCGASGEQTLVAAYNPTIADVFEKPTRTSNSGSAQFQPDEALTARREEKLRKKFILHAVEAHGRSTPFQPLRHFGRDAAGGDS